MSKNTFVLFIFLSLVSAFVVTSCSKGGCGVSNISYHGGYSHNAGRDCMGCHSSGGEGKGCFTAAGTVFNSSYTNIAANGTIKLWTGMNGQGTIRATVQVDAAGNMHTTDNIDYSGGLYPSVTSSSGSTLYMQQPITSGACNSCHGQSTNRLFVY